MKTERKTKDELVAELKSACRKVKKLEKRLEKRDHTEEVASGHNGVEGVMNDSDERFRELIESLPQLFWTCRVDGPCDYLSRQWVEYTGVPEADQLGYRWLEQLHPEDKDRTVSEWMEKVKTGESFDVEFRIRRSDGVYHWFKTRAVPLRDDEGRIFKWFGSNTDVDDIRRSRDTQERLVSTIESSTDLISYADTSANILYMNRAGMSMLGLNTDDDITKYKIEQFISDDAKYDMFNVILPEIFSAGSWRGDSAFKDIAGKEIPVALSCSLLKNKDGEPEYLAVNARDITERKKAEDALRESEERFRIAAETSNDVVYEWDLNQSVQWFGKIDEMLGYDPGEFPRTLDGLGASVHPEDWVRVMASVQAHLEGRAPYAEDYRAIKKDGSFRWWSARGAVTRTPDGKPVRWIGTVTDITDHKMAEEEIRRLNDGLEETVKQRTTQLQDALELNQKIIETSSLGIFACREDGPCIIANPAVARISGASVEQMLKLNFRELDSWKKNGLFEKVETALQTKKEQRAEIHLTTSFGKDAWINYYVTTFSAGGRSHFLMTVDDITERKLVEEAVGRANAYNRSLLEASVDPLVMIGPEGKITDVNGATEAITGCTRQALIGSKFSDYFTDPEKADDGYRRAFADGFIRNYELELRHKDGKTTPVNYNATVYRDDAGRVIGVFAAARDVTEMKAVAAKLLTSKQLLDETGRLARVGGWEIDLRKNQLSWSDVVKQIHEVGPDFQPTLEGGINFYAPEAVPVISEAVRSATVDGTPFDVELQLITARQNRIWVRAVGQAYRDNGEIVRVGGVFQDINERKLAEQGREALMKQIEVRSALLEAANKELEAFTYSVSHDLRAPLRHTSGYVELLAKRCESELPENGKRYLLSIADSVRQMGKLIDDLLQFSRTGRMEMRQRDVDMKSIVQETIESFRKDNPGRTIEWASGALSSVYGDEAMLRLVWINLLSNAVKFTRTREKARIEIGVRKENKELVFFVRDNGVGFDMQYAQKLFGVFQRLHPTEEFEGTGIGLANVRRIVLRHGGRTWAEAELDKGATFYFSIPTL